MINCQQKQIQRLNSPFRLLGSDGKSELTSLSSRISSLFVSMTNRSMRESRTILNESVRFLVTPVENIDRDSITNYFHGNAHLSTIENARKMAKSQFITKRKKRFERESNSKRFYKEEPVYQAPAAPTRPDLFLRRWRWTFASAGQKRQAGRRHLQVRSPGRESSALLCRTNL